MRWRIKRKYINLSPGIISVNMSVSAPGSQRNSVHSGLSEMPVFSPEFLVCDHLYTLTLLLHQAEYTGDQSRQVSGLMSAVNMSPIWNYMVFPALL